MFTSLDAELTPSRPFLGSSQLQSSTVHICSLLWPFVHLGSMENGYAGKMENGFRSEQDNTVIIRWVCWF